MSFEKLKEIFSDTFDIEENSVADDTSRDTLEGWDSLNHLRLVTAIEQEFGISLTMDEINSMSNFVQVQEYVSKHTQS